MSKARWAVLALAGAAVAVLGGLQSVQAGENTSTNTGIYGATGDYQSAQQYADAGMAAQGGGASPPPAAPVPEPGTMTLVALGLYGLHRRMRRTSRR